MSDFIGEFMMKKSFGAISLALLLATFMVGQLWQLAQAAPAGNNSALTLSPSEIQGITPTHTIFLPTLYSAVLKLTQPSGPVSYGRFGAEVVIDDTTMVISSCPNSVTISTCTTGFIYIYEQQPSGHWELQQQFTTIHPTDERTLYGGRVALDGDVLAVGAYLENSIKGIESGVVYIYERVAGVWQLATTVIGDDISEYSFFGYSLAVEGQTIVVGAPAGYDNITGPGAAYIFEKQDNQWVQTHKLTADITITNPLLEFGSAAAIYENTIAIGAPGFNANHAPSGSIIFFEKNQTTNSWEQIQILTPFKLVTEPNYDLYRFGETLAMNNETLAVGISNHNYAGFTYEKDSNGHWVNPIRIPLDIAILTVVLDDDMMAVGNNSSLFLLQKSDSSVWQEIVHFPFSNDTQTQAFRNKFTLDGNYLGIGHNTQNIGQNEDAGQVYVHYIHR